MCGIAGIVAADRQEISRDRLKKMTDILYHRGPDGEGHWINSDGRIGFGHRRLSIIDLSVAGKQPMHFAERYTITYNGEIYNYVELRDLCKANGYVFKTQTDTEVLMALYDWKGAACLVLLDGMFSFAIYDQKEKKVFAARDRFGEKPFYYYHEAGRCFVFASEMKALWAADVKREVNNAMLFNYLEFGYITNPNDKSETFFNGIRLLPQAHYILLNVDDLSLTLVKYWDIDHTIQDMAITEEKAKSTFLDLFYGSVRRRLRSDVPVGSSLSGGLDSSAVVCVIDDLNKGKSIKQNTFSAVFPGFEHDESSYINAVLDRLNVKPYFTTPDAGVMLKELRNVFYYHEEPFISASMLAQYEVMKLAKKHNVTVLLDGQGADEILAGYHPFYQYFFEDLKRTDNKLFKQERKAYLTLHGNSSANPVPKADIKNYIKKISGPLKQPLKKVYNWYGHTKSPKFNDDFYHTYKKKQITLDSPATTLNHALYNSMQWGMAQLMRYGDRSSMAHSREVRLPFLNHDLVEFIFKLPPHLKIHNGWTKYIQRKTFEHIIPEVITWRRDKVGYEPPQRAWMQQKSVQDEIMACRELLVKNHILHKRMLHIPIKPARPSEATDGSWQHWMSGFLINGVEKTTE